MRPRLDSPNSGTALVCLRRIIRFDARGKPHQTKETVIPIKFMQICAAAHLFNVDIRVF